MIYVTHDQTEALTFADTVVVMHDGAVVQTGTPEELFERPGAYLRRPFHRLAGHERAAVPGRGRHGLYRRRSRSSCRGPIQPARGARIELGIRPEFVQLQPKRRGPSGHGAAHRRSRPRAASPGSRWRAAQSRRACRTRSMLAATEAASSSIRASIHIYARRHGAVER